MCQTNCKENIYFLTLWSCATMKLRKATRDSIVSTQVKVEHCKKGKCRMQCSNEKPQSRRGIFKPMIRKLAVNKNLALFTQRPPSHWLQSLTLTQNQNSLIKTTKKISHAPILFTHAKTTSRWESTSYSPFYTSSSNLKRPLCVLMEV